jgi:molybdenum cofactor guanylyltransferase
LSGAGAYRFPDDLSGFAPDLAVLVLAGGRSRRMGRDKASLPWGQGTLLEHVRAVASQCAAEVWVSGTPPCADLHGGHGPLDGLASGLARTARPWVVVLACDLPFVRVELIALLLRHRAPHVDAIVPRVGGYAQPLLAVYAREVTRQVAERLLARGERSMHALLAELAVCWVAEPALRVADPSLSCFTNLNTPHDYAMALEQQPSAGLSTPGRASPSAGDV